MDPIDRISGLPEGILHYILSCLNPEEAARTSVLSRTWHDIGTRNPFLVFRYAPEHPSGDDQRGRKRRKVIDYEESKRKFRNYVESRLRYFLKHEPSVILKFHLVIQNHYNHDQDSPGIDSWLEQVMNKGIKNLYLSVCTTGLYSYKLPQHVLNSCTLTELALYYCNLDAARGNIKLPNLQKLRIGCQDVDEDFIKHLISGCRLLQLLHIWGSLRLTNLRVTGLPCLQNVQLSGCQGLANVEIQSPNLGTFMYWGKQRMQCDFTLAPSNMLNKLMLVNVVVNPGWLQQQVSKCKNLYLGAVSGIENIEFSNPKLETLEILSCLGMNKTVKIDCPNLDSLGFCWNKLPFHSAEDNFKLRNMHLKFCYENDQQASLWLQKIDGLFNNFSLNKELIKLAISHDGHEDVIILDGLTELALHMLRDYKELMPKCRVQISSVKSCNDMRCFMSGTLFGPRFSFKTLHVASAYGNHNFSQMLYEMLSKAQGEAACCDEPECLRSWQHNLCIVTKSSTSKISEIRSYHIPAALRSLESGPYQITRIELKGQNEAT